MLFRSLATTYHFDYGPTAAYGSSTPEVAAGDGHSAVAASAALAGLLAGTTYHYRVVATSAGGATPGADAAFTTAPLPCACPAIVLHGQTTLSRSAKVKKGVAQLKLSCAAGPCSGKLALTIRSHHKALKLGSKSFWLAKGHRLTLKLKLTNSGRRLLDRARKHRLKVTATLTPTGGRAAKKSVSLSGR